MGRRTIVGVALAVLATGCTGGSTPSVETASPPPVITPSSAYPAFAYSSPTQRATFEAFVSCAANHGLTYEGPFEDSSGTGVFLRLADGEDATDAQQREVNDACPELTVALFGTPVGHVDERRFAAASADLASCVRTNGVADFPDPASGGDPVAAFWDLPFDWTDPSFVEAIRACVDTLRGYLFP
jgi:hypothetical protein